VKTWDVIIVGAGVIGLSLAISLRKQGLRVLVIERGEPGREASYAAAGMLAPDGNEIPPALKELAQISSGLYPEFVHELVDESGFKIDFSKRGTLLLSADTRFPRQARKLSNEEVSTIEPALNLDHLATANIAAAFIAERAVDPRSLMAALIKTAQHRGVDISSGTEVKSVLISGEHVAGVQTDPTSYAAPAVVNCAGAWSGIVGPHRFPVNPVKGQMLALVHGPELKHVIRGDDVYVVPRADERLVIGSTLEDAGYDRRVDVSTIKRLLDSAKAIVPALAWARQHDAWAGLRPGTPDCLPILGPTATPGYFVATGHYRDGILLAPVTARVMTAVILGKTPPCDLANFAPSRFIDKAA
jgi:glycine oxidase